MHRPLVFATITLDIIVVANDAIKKGHCIGKIFKKKISVQNLLMLLFLNR